jgi:hypothetical protein
MRKHKSYEESLQDLGLNAPTEDLIARQQELAELNRKIIAINFLLEIAPYNFFYRKRTLFWKTVFTQSRFGRGF